MSVVLFRIESALKRCTLAGNLGSGLMCRRLFNLVEGTVEHRFYAWMIGMAVVWDDSWISNLYLHDRNGSCEG